MKADDFIKQVIEEEVETLELSDDVFNKIIGNMEMNEGHWWEKLKLFTMMKKIISNLHIIDIIEVAVFVFVLIFVPFGVTHYNVHISEVRNLKNTNSYNNKIKGIDKSYDDTDKAEISQENAIDNVINLKQMNLTLPSNWKKQGNENELFFANENNQTIGGISLVGFYDEDHYPVPNHSEIVKTEDIEVKLGKGKLFTLKRDNPPASGDTKTWNELHAIIPANKNNLAYDIWIEGTNKDTLLNILKSIN